MDVRYVVVDAFSQRLFGGNPAGVCLLEQPLGEDLMQRIAAENNLAETAFVIARGEDYDLRWFTPEKEIDLCGHATLGTAFALSRFVQPEAGQFRFHSRSGLLTVRRQGELWEMDFPSRPPVPCGLSPAELQALARTLGAPVLEAHSARDLLLLLDSAQRVRELEPDMIALKALDYFGIVVTALGADDVDFVSRYFAPGAGVPEDPVTGSSHASLIPFWSARLGKDHLLAHQLSRRGGVLHCCQRGERVLISGHAVLYLEGLLHL